MEDIRSQYENPDEIVLTFDTLFREVGEYDSLTGMSILVVLKDDYGVDIPEDTFRNLQTISELYQFVNPDSK